MHAVILIYLFIVWLCVHVDRPITCFGVVGVESSWWNTESWGVYDVRPCWRH